MRARVCNVDVRRAQSGLVADLEPFELEGRVRPVRSLEQVATILGCSRERVRQIEDVAMEKLAVALVDVCGGGDAESIGFHAGAIADVRQRRAPRPLSMAERVRLAIGDVGGGLGGGGWVSARAVTAAVNAGVNAGVNGGPSRGVGRDLGVVRNELSRMVRVGLLRRRRVGGVVMYALVDGSGGGAGAGVIQ
jgi:hypothetical protein